MMAKVGEWTEFLKKSGPIGWLVTLAFIVWTVVDDPEPVKTSDGTVCPKAKSTDPFAVMDRLIKSLEKNMSATVIVCMAGGWFWTTTRQASARAKMHEAARLRETENDGALIEQEKRLRAVQVDELGKVRADFAREFKDQRRATEKLLSDATKAVAVFNAHTGNGSEPDDKTEEMG